MKKDTQAVRMTLKHKKELEKKLKSTENEILKIDKEILKLQSKKKLLQSKKNKVKFLLWSCNDKLLN